MDPPPEAASEKEHKDSVTFPDLVNDDFLIANFPPCMEIMLICIFSYSCLALLLFYMSRSLLIFFPYSRLPQSAHTLSPYPPISDHHLPVLRRRCQATPEEISLGF
jgi:hypothetical protein